MKKKKEPVKAEVPPKALPLPEKDAAKRKAALEVFTKPPAEFTRALADEIVRGLTTTFGRFTARPFTRHEEGVQPPETDRKTLGEHPILLDTSILIDGRILPIVNSGFLTGTLLIPQFVLGEVQHIADSSDSLRRAKGRRGLDVANKVKGQRVNGLVRTQIIPDDILEQKEVDHKLVALAKRLGSWLLTVDFNLAHLARAQGVKVLNINDLTQALKLAIIPGEELTIKITHEGKERAQGVGYLADGTMVVVDDAKDKVGMEVVAIVTKVHQTPAGQLFFARLK